jgi:hypothetical protein
LISEWFGGASFLWASELSPKVGTGSEGFGRIGPNFISGLDMRNGKVDQKT